MNMLTPIKATPIASALPKAHCLNKESRLKGEILETLARLDGGAGKKISRGVLRDDLIATGAIETDGSGNMTSSARHKFSRAMVALCRKHGALRERNGVVWRVGAVAARERAVASAVDKERAASAAAIAERDCASKAWEHAGAIAKAQHAATLADLERKVATNVERADGLEQRLKLAGERARVAERKLAHAATRERMVAETVAEFGRRLSVLDRKPRDLEPSFQD
jgi:hypothetical protein